MTYTIVGLVLVLIGTAWLIIDGQKFFFTLGFVHNMYDHLFRQLGDRDIVVPVGLDEHVTQGVRAGRRATFIGLPLIGIGTIFQIVGALTSACCIH